MNFSAEMTRQVLSAVQARSSRDELIELSSKLSFSELGNAYIDSTKPDTEAADHFVDKLPFNYLYLGLIHLALPKAKIVHVECDPMDTCYAIYKTLFDAAYPFSYDLDELGRYYLAYRQLMDHCSEVLPNRFYNLQYENWLRRLSSKQKPCWPIVTCPGKTPVYPSIKTRKAPKQPVPARFVSPYMAPPWVTGETTSSSLNPCVHYLRKLDVKLHRHS